MKIVDSVWVSAYMKDTEIMHFSCTCLSGTLLVTLKSVGINDPEGQEKYNNSEVRYGRLLKHSFFSTKYNSKHFLTRNNSTCFHLSFCYELFVLHI
jgi:hypothetical protein